MTAKFLHDAGHEIIGVYAKLHDRKPGYHEHNIANVAMVAQFLGVEYRVADLSGEFNEAVFTPFVEGYRRGLTPNPCAICNRKIKFGALWRLARELGAEKIATGHYARVKNGRIYEALDPTKDQSYFLSNIEPEMVARLVFPLGERLKTDIKAAAARIPQIASLAAQRESSEICFVPGDYTDVLREHFDIDRAGVVRNAAGEAVGEHGGYAKYTVGKRRGFSVRGAHEPHFVLRTDAARNEIVVGRADELVCYGFETSNFNDFGAFGGEFSAGGAGNGVGGDEFEAFVKVRYRSAKIPCKVRRIAGEFNNESGGELNSNLTPNSNLASGGGGGANSNLAGASENFCGGGGGENHSVGGNFVGGVRVELAQNARAVASGQLAVFYSADGGVIGSGFIK